MQEEQISKLKTGQVCELRSPEEGPDPQNVYLIVEVPGSDHPDQEVILVSLKDLQRNIEQPEATQRLVVDAGQISVLAESLQAYIQSWNSLSR